METELVERDDRPEAGMAGRYVYCVAPLLELGKQGLKGIMGKPVYQLAYREIGALVHDCPAEPYQGSDEEVKSWLLQHHQVVDAVWELAGSVLPMTFDMIVKETAERPADENVVSWLRENYEFFRDKLNSFSGKVELGVQVLWDREQAVRRVEADDPEVRRLEEESKGKGRGAAFFWRQRRGKLVNARVEAMSEAICQDLLQRLPALATGVRTNKPKRLERGEMLLNLSLLAERRRIGEIGALLGEVDQREGVTICFTGPWPPYSFVADPQPNQVGQADDVSPAPRPNDNR